MSLLFLITSVALGVTPVAPQSVLNSPDRSYAVHFSAELGTLSVLAHRIQFSKSGTMIDYVEEGGQDNLFPYARLQSELSLGDRLCAPGRRGWGCQCQLEAALGVVS